MKIEFRKFGNEWERNLFLTEVEGVSRFLAKITFTYEDHQYWLVVTTPDLIIDQPNIFVDGYGPSCAALSWILRKKYWQKIKEAFSFYQQQIDFLETGQRPIDFDGLETQTFPSE
ncbi:hypothetical protein KHS38_11920 [Mucilaginibacter sp. Bleaf8]|uniref:hypothetical protein n=1 Tax=Mucilaginibacter sp. Bleaf8 TaxID=2834430 RepID=UPI001BCF8C4D|nr:hypothetical protein [Mucilaginibacter sp. Bleaf8]MBS7565113.1 hypothetical protein [Mucilaginibacter sp. Bleaf8]